MSHQEAPETDVEETTDAEQDRSVRAGELCSQACEDCGVKVCNLDEFVAWNKYVDGEIDQKKLNEEAREEIQQLAKSFGKYLVMEKEDSTEHAHDQERQERAELASRIYRKACQDAGVRIHFFQNFTIWSDFVNGRISEEELYEKAMLELKELAQ
jgi:hypothetical protein